MTEDQQLRKIMKELKTAEYIGEDGGMVVNCATQLGAYRKMLKKIREDCSEGEAEEFKEYCKQDDLGTAFLHLATKEYKEEFGDDVEWCVSMEKESKYRLWCYWG